MSNRYWRQLSGTRPRFEPVGDRIARRSAVTDAGPTELHGCFTDTGLQPELAALTTWRELVPRLREILTVSAETRVPDVWTILRQIGRGYACVHLPRRTRRQSGQHLPLIEDRSDRMSPYWEDQSLVPARLATLFPRHAF